MIVSKPNPCLVLQGYFRIEGARGAGPRAVMLWPLAPRGPSPRPPRPGLLPLGLRGAVGQPRAEATSGALRRGAPRPELLPGMGPARVGGPPRIGQARSSRRCSTTPIPPAHLRAIGEGRPLEPGLRRTVEGIFQADFSGVRIHSGPAAPALGALAVTLDDRLHFAPGLYDPTTRRGLELLGHELTHVVQQRAGRVANPYGRGIALVQDPALEAEAEAMGHELAAAVWARRHGGAQPTRRPAAIRAPALPKAARPAAIAQPMRGMDLEAMSAQALEDVGVKAATEVQAIHVDGQVAMTANEPTAMKGLSPLQGSKLCDMPGLWKLAKVKTADSASDCATKLAVADRSLIILKGDDFVGVDVHAEQRLLVALAYLLQGNKVPDTIHVWGAKPPCGSCKQVLTAFTNALSAVYDKILIFSNAAGQDRKVPQISLSAIFGVSPPGEFGRFVRIYETELAKQKL